MVRGMIRWVALGALGLAALGGGCDGDAGGGEADAAADTAPDTAPEGDEGGPPGDATDDTAADDTPAGPGDADAGPDDNAAGDVGEELPPLVMQTNVCVGELCAADPSHAPDPSTWGPFPVGVTTFEIDALGFDDEPRRLTIEVWYPAVESARGGPFESIDVVSRAPDDVKAIVEGIEVDAVPTHSVRDAPIRAGDGPFPTVIFSHGAFGIRFQSVFWTEVLASHGYVVPSIDHQGNTLYDMVLEGYSLQAVGINGLHRPYDVKATIDAMMARNATEGDRFYRTMVPDQVAMSGHSFGGYVSFVAAFDDPRVKAIVPMTPATSPLNIQGYWLDELAVPVMLMASGKDDTLDTDNEMREPFEDIPPPKAWFELLDGGHFTYSDVCALDLKKIADQLEIVGADGPLSDGCSPDNVAVAVAHPLIRQFGIGFLNYWMRGSAGSKTWFSPEAAAAHADVMAYGLEE